MSVHMIGDAASSLLTLKYGNIGIPVSILFSETFLSLLPLVGPPVSLASVYLHFPMLFSVLILS